MEGGQGHQCFVNSNPDFCDECGTLLPIPGAEHMVVCNRCGFRRHASDFEGIKSHSVSREYAFQKPKFNTRVDERVEGGGATVDEECPKCNKKGMTFTTAQLRSADEGQTIFYTCNSCGYKFSLNS